MQPINIILSLISSSHDTGRDALSREGDNHMLQDAPLAIIPSNITYHGGAWKVAYADFVTAMMAFFLLMWLLNATSEEQKKGLAEYFTPTVDLKDQMGIGSEGGISPTEEGIQRNSTSPMGLVEGRPNQGETPDLHKQSQIDGSQEAKLFELAEKEMQQAMESDPNLREYTENIIMEQSPEGLKLTLKDSDKHPMYKAGSTNLSEHGRIIIAAMTPLIQKMPNHISITGHTDAQPSSNKKVSNWEISTERANSARRYFIKTGLESEKVAKIVGRASKDLLIKERPSASQNRRIEIIMLKGSHLAIGEQYKPASRAILSAPRSGDFLDKRRRKQKREAEAAKRSKAQKNKAEKIENLKDSLSETPAIYSGSE